VTGLPVWVDPAADRIVVNGRPLPKAEKDVYVMLNKAARVLTSCRVVWAMTRWAVGTGTIRSHVMKRLRTAGYKIKSKSGVGYFIPSA